NKPQLCETYARKGIVLDPKYPGGHRTLGVCLRNLKRYPEALTSGLEAVRLDGKYGEGYRALGYTYLAMRNAERVAKNHAKAGQYDAKAREMVAKLKELGENSELLEEAVNKP
ncbi:MAG: hypothetical protein IT173_10010, partial [Acidobacteria bacterium]|nr:hypothetical protein [Acidobacteriota bacterium]